MEDGLILHHTLNRRRTILTNAHTAVQKPMPPTNSPVPYLAWKSWGAVELFLTWRAATPGETTHHQLFLLAISFYISKGPKLETMETTSWTEAILREDAIMRFINII